MQNLYEKIGNVGSLDSLSHTLLHACAHACERAWVCVYDDDDDDDDDEIIIGISALVAVKAEFMIDIFGHTHSKHIMQCRCLVFCSFAVLSSLPPWWSDSTQGLQHPYTMYASEHLTGNVTTGMGLQLNQLPSTMT